MSKEILCTIGPSSLKKSVLERLDELSVNLLRINLSHTSITDFPKCIEEIRAHTSIPICIDSEGAQIRTGKMKEGTVCLSEGELIKIDRRLLLGDSNHINFYPEETLDLIETGDLISIDFNTALIQVADKTVDYLMARVITEGVIGSNKAVSVNRHIKMKALTAKDKAAIKIASEFGILHFALSFANNLEDVRQIKGLAPKEGFIISKIESREGIKNLKSIASESDAILIDRGDLSREEPIESIPLLQKDIIYKAKNAKTKVYVATNLLESMVTHKNPTRAEVNDIFNTLLDGADGLVLAAETAIGNNPVGCVNMVSKLIDQFQYFSECDADISKYEKRSLLVESHGGPLVSRIKPEMDSWELSKFPALEVSESIVLDCEQIATGVYSPLQGFMTQDQMESVLDKNLLPEGVVWTLPIIFPVWRNSLGNVQNGDSLALKNGRSGEVFALLHLEEIYSFKVESIAQRILGTSSANHPGVKQLKNSGDTLLGGKIDLINFSKKPKEVSPFIYNPQNTRMIFEQKNWYRVAGFHTSNLVHKAHEYIQQIALNEFFCDGIFINPVVAPQVKSKIKGEWVLKSYLKLIEKNLYPKNKFLLGGILARSYWASPREAVFRAICQKNFGCSHFILGKQSSFKDVLYPAGSNIKIFEEIGDIGIKPIFVDQASYCDKCEMIRQSCKHPQSNIHSVNGGLINDFIKRKEKPPNWMMREEISGMLFDAINAGEGILSV